MKKKLIFVLKILILVILFCWIVMVFTDYFRARNNNEPMFCVSEKTIDYPDGSTYICTGLGYKMIRYNRSCMSATEFGPFVIKERQCNKS